MEHFDVVILGGGASGTMCALSSHGKVALVDSASKMAKKVLVTGNGRCNLTNTDITGTTEHYNQDISAYLKRFSVEQTLHYFSSLGLEYYADEQNRVYPLSNMAKSVMDVLDEALVQKNVQVLAEHTVLEIEKEGNKFVVKTNKQTFSCNKLVIALGGNASGVLNDLDVDIKPFVPSLCALKTRNTKLLSGIRLDNVAVTAINHASGQKQTRMGEVLFKDAGLSGIVVFDLSTLFSREGNFDGELLIDIFPKWSHEQLVQKLKERRALDVKVSNFFVGLLANGVAYEVFERCHTNEQRGSSQLTDKELEQFAKVLKNFSFSIAGNYDNNQVFSGGVPLNSLTADLESKTIPNLFFCGEICDVDGICGGYNLQWAWTSGHIVGQAL